MCPRRRREPRPKGQNGEETAIKKRTVTSGDKGGPQGSPLERKNNGGEVGRPG